MFSADADTAQTTLSSPPETFEDSFVERKSVDNFDMAAFDDQWAETQQGFPSGKLLQYKVSQQNLFEKSEHRRCWESVKQKTTIRTPNLQLYSKNEFFIHPN